MRDNLCTFFNFVFLALAACCVAVGAYRDTLFLGIVVIHALIGIVQELRVKHKMCIRDSPCCGWRLESGGAWRWCWK